MRLWAQALLLVFLAVFGCAGIIGADAMQGTGPCPDQDVWVYIKHPDPWHETCVVVVHIPKHSLTGDFKNCPAQDTKVVGQGRIGLSKFAGMHVVVLKKGTLNERKNYTTKPPRKIKIPENNVNTWHADK